MSSSGSLLNLQGSLCYTPAFGVSKVISPEGTILIDLTFVAFLSKGSTHLIGSMVVVLLPSPLLCPQLNEDCLITSRGLELIRRAGDMEEETDTRGNG